MNLIDDFLNPSDSEHAQQVAISGKTALEQVIVKIIGLAKREILIILPQMHELWNNDNITQSLVHFINYSAKRDVLILLNNLDVQTNPDHYLVRLSQRVPNRIQLKQVSALLDKPIMRNDYLIIVDKQHTLRINDIDKYAAWFDANIAARAQNYAESFILQWPKAHEITEYRQFTL